jgi:hypothetical protein
LWPSTHPSSETAGESGRCRFVVAVGVLLAIIGDLSRVGIGGGPLGAAAAKAAVRVAGWALAGLAMAWAMRPPAGKADPA